MKDQTKKVSGQQKKNETKGNSNELRVGGWVALVCPGQLVIKPLPQLGHTVKPQTSPHSSLALLQATTRTCKFAVPEHTPERGRAGLWERERGGGATENDLHLFICVFSLSLVSSPPFPSALC